MDKQQVKTRAVFLRQIPLLTPEKMLNIFLNQYTIAIKKVEQFKEQAIKSSNSNS